MPQHRAILQTVKAELKKLGITYQDLACQLQLSESTVKRMFALNAVSLERLDQICAVMNMEISEIVQSMEQQAKRIEQLSLEQEKELVSDTRMLLIAISLLNKWSYAEILETYDISEFESTRLMARLDRMQIIDLLPGNRVKLRISQNFSWRPDGPIQKFFENSVKTEYFDCKFNKQGELQLFVTGMLSKKSNAELIARLQKLATEFYALHEDDSSLSRADRAGTSMVLAIRPWEFKAFKALRKSATEQTD